VADHSKDDPHARCLPPNFSRAFAFPHHQKFIQIPGLRAFLSGGSAAILARLFVGEVGGST
jgi:hypothetical protein